MESFQLSESELEEFKTEAFELLDQAEQNLLKIDQGGKFSTNYDAIFRAYHSIKGAAGMLGLEVLQKHMHQVETQLQSCKEDLTLPKARTTYFLRAIDAARSILNQKPVQFEYILPEESEGKDKTSHQAKSPEPNVSHSLGRVYVVDDEPDIVDLIQEILEEANLEVEGFSEAKNLLSRMKERQPDVILSDMRMPEMSGMDLLRSVNQLTPELPLIFISGHLTKEMLIEGLRLGIAGVLEKPFDASKVVVATVTAMKRYQISTLLNRSVNFIMYQFSDLDRFLKDQGKEEIRKLMKKELENILQARRELKSLRISKEEV